MRIRCFIALIAPIQCLSVATAAQGQAQDVSPPHLAMRAIAGPEPAPGQSITLDFYTELSWDLRLFDSRRAAELGLLYPYCINANSPEWDNEDKIALNRKWVRVTGTFAERPATYDPRGTEINGARYSNDCFGPLVLELQSAEVLDQDLYRPLDCIDGTFNLCIPPEWDQDWTYHGMLIRHPAPALDGPIVLSVEAKDYFFDEPIHGLTRTRLGNYFLYFTFDCQHSACALTTAQTALHGLDHAETRGLSRRRYQVNGDTPDDLRMALEQLRFCPIAECRDGPSISLAELREIETAN